MDDVNPPMTYRQRQAEETKSRIAAAARELFARQGYAQTSMEAIAAEVGVAVRTVYAAFGTKKAILGAICQQWLERAQTLVLVQEAMRVTGARRRLALVARAVRLQWEQGGDILAMLELAAAGDAEISALVNGWAGERAAAMGGVLAGVEGELLAPLGVAGATDVLRAMTAPQVYRSLVGDSGWEPDRFEHWLADALAALLLTPKRPSRTAM